MSYKRVVVDATVFGALVIPGASVVDPHTRSVIVDAADRAQALVGEIISAGGTLVIPAPALAETLCGIAAEQRIPVVERIAKHARMRIAEFGTRAAIQLSQMSLSEVTSDTRQNLKFDRQIVAVALVESATLFLSQDRSQLAYAERHGVPCAHLGQVAIPDDGRPLLQILGQPPEAEPRGQ